MLDAKGVPIRLGDHLEVGPNLRGIVVISFDTDEYTPAFPKADWYPFIEKGIMVETQDAGLVHLETSDEDILVLEPQSPQNL